MDTSTTRETAPVGDASQRVNALRRAANRALFPRVSNHVEAAPDLQAEARIFGRYLGGRMPPPELIDRYVEANRVLRATAVSERDAAIVTFVRRHPWAVSCLDAAAGLFARDGLLRSKLLVMAAILEASPAFADEFLPRASGRLALAARLIALGVVVAAQVGFGAVLYAVAVRSGAPPAREPA